MSEPLNDFEARERFRREWDRNFAVSANAGSGKTTAISERLAAIALAPDGAEILRKTAVVTYTRKAAAQIGQKARQVLLKHLARQPGSSLAALDHLERAFFGTIHSFCLKLAQTYGQTAGINLNPQLVAENDDALWEEFLEGDSMQFAALPEPQLAAFLRHVPLEEVFALARRLDTVAARSLGGCRPGPPAQPPAAVLAQILELARKGTGATNIALSQQRAQAWQQAWERGHGFLPLYEPAGSSQKTTELARRWMAPLKRWLAAAAAVLAAELAGRYRAWRFERGVQTYADQIDAALAVLRDDARLDRIRREGWRIVLDEAQDTDPSQFAVLVEIARPPGAALGTWPATDAGAGHVPGPRAGHFCLVGDGQQAIYSSRADIGNFTRHVEAFRRGDSGERLEFQVTFRTPAAVVAALNDTLPAAFGRAHPYSFGLPPAEGAPAPFLQVEYVPLRPGPANVAGACARLPLVPPATAPEGVASWLAEEARQVANHLRAQGPAGVGAQNWGEVAVLAPRNEWLLAAPESIWEKMSPEALKYRILLKGKTLLTFSSSKRRSGDATGTQGEAGRGGVDPDGEASAVGWADEIDEIDEEEEEDSDDEAGSRSMLMTHGNLGVANEDSWHVEEEDDDGSGRAKHHHLHQLHLPHLPRNLHLPHLPHLPHLHRAGHRQPGGGETNQRSSMGDEAPCQRHSAADDADPGAPSTVEASEHGVDSAGSSSAGTTRQSSRSHHVHLHLPNLHLPHLGHFSAAHHEDAPPSEAQAAGGDAAVLPHLHAHHQALHHRHAHTMHLLNHGPPKESRQSVKLSSSLSSLTYLSVVKTSSHLRPGMAPCQASAPGSTQTR